MCDKSIYFKNLCGIAAERYAVKIKVIDNCDPYYLNFKDMSVDFLHFPTIEMIDLVNYLILTHSYYTGQQLKAYKSLEAYKYFNAGFIEKMAYKKINNFYVVVAKVKHSRKFSNKPVDVWIIIIENGSVSSAHCTCMAGLGEVCSHIAAVLFAIQARTSVDTDSCTEKLALWPIPSTSNVSMSRLADMAWKTQCTEPKTTIPALEGDTFISFLKEVQQTGTDSAIFRIIEPFASEIASTTVDEENLPLILTELYNDDLKHLSHAQLLSLGSDISLSITAEECEAVKRITISQSESSNWYNFRSGRITASKFKAVCRTSLSNPSLSLIKGICYPQKIIFRSKQTDYGLRHEKAALDTFEKIQKTKHENVSVVSTGLHISISHPQLGASPDGIITCSCCGIGCIEIKCPFSMKNEECSMKDYAKKKWTCLIYNEENETFTLNTNHNYYYQVQMQMFVTGLQYCEFVLWAPHTIFIERIIREDNLLQIEIPKTLLFHKHVILPELLARYYTERAGCTTEELWCMCKKSDDGSPMIQCENDDCLIKWFHLQCLNMYDIPNELWYCNNCK